MPIKIQLLSDTHGNVYTLSPDADLIVHAGDFSNSGIVGIMEFQTACRAANKPFICVLGNHDYYHGNIGSVYAELDKMGFPYLRAGKIFEYQGYTFVGGTLFTDFRKSAGGIHMANRLIAESNISDFYCIRIGAGDDERLVRGEDYMRMFELESEFIGRFRHRDKTVILTHFPPSTVCQDPRYEGSLLNPYFINDMDLEGFSLWLSGHTHKALDIVCQGCRIVINPLGYPLEHGCNGFRQDLLIELD
ncbi:metallophosphoesterase family protein [Neisseria cinerea]|jgi:putative metallophosphoesterase|uniref:Ser/Thr phosphatase family protein n=1 Tax=Neisseria cinerea ATCC 14685 TaxID=546262 RepID=D0W133_NEICI|nr:metallophosphoesterase [Neisseria cinerea]EEZ72421.1 Ser/Thr phosphatase family protein [Neisseria cinerea ATCC 14685]MCD2070679.1 metallophosphoesterase [Neisseria cinerea]